MYPIIRTLLMSVVLVSCALGAETATRPAKPFPEVEHVLIVSIDGLRPDCALLAETPNLHALVKSGAYTFWAKTTAVSITLPSHTSMLTGVIPDKHGIQWNYELPLKEPVYPRVPTVFELATKAGYSTALIAGKAKFSALNKPGTVSVAWIPTAQASDEEVAAAAVKVIEQNKPDLIFVHFPDVDAKGHGVGWGSPEQLRAVAGADRGVGLLLGALERVHIRESTIVLVTADHGGAGRTHGPDDARSRHIPWIIAGPKVKGGYDLTRSEGDIRTEDTFATTAYLLGLPLAPYLDGKPVMAAFTTPE